MLKLCETSQTTFANLQFVWNMDTNIDFLILLLYDNLPVQQILFDRDFLKRNIRLKTLELVLCFNFKT